MWPLSSRGMGGKAGPLQKELLFFCGFPKYPGCTCEIRVFGRVVGKEVEYEHEEPEGEQQAAQDIEVRGILGHAPSDHVASHAERQGRI